MFAAGHDDHLIGLVIGTCALFAARDDFPDDPAEEVTIGAHHAPAVQRLWLAFAHPAIVPMWSEPFGPANADLKVRATGTLAGMTDEDPTVLWRMTRGRSTAHATIIPGTTQTTITWFFDGVMDRVENYDSVALALARADDIKGVLLRDGWTEA
jgi:hypothetical protein